MAFSHNFAVIRLRSSSVRDESLNIGIVVAHEGEIRVHCPKRLDKIRAISSALSPEDLIDDFASLHSDLTDTFQSASDFGTAVDSVLQYTPYGIVTKGEFLAESVDSYDSEVSWLLRSFVEPEPAALKPIRKRPTQLKASIKKALRLEKILARKADGIESHRVLHNHKLTEGVIVDFVLKNGAMHVIETIDAASEMISLKKVVTDIAVSAFSFEHARLKFEHKQGVEPRLIFRASSLFEKSIQPSLDAAAHQGAALYNWESTQDRHRFMNEMASLAEPYEGIKQPTIHASTQSRLKLN